MATVPDRRSGPSTVAARKDFLSLLDSARDQIAQLLPDHVKVDRVIRVARSAYLADQNLQKCSPGSILRSVMSACELGLEPGGSRKHCFLVPFKGECALILGYPGLLELARRSGQFKAIETRIVYENDVFDLAYTPEPITRHVPTFDRDPGVPRLVYAYARLSSGEIAFELMTFDQVEAIRKRLPDFQANGPAWRNFWGEMARKVVLKRLLKRLPSSIELADAVDNDNEVERPDQVEAVARRPALDRAEELADRLGLPLEAAIETQLPDATALDSLRTEGGSADDADPDRA